MDLLHGPEVPGQKVLEVSDGAREIAIPEPDQVHLLDQRLAVVQQGEDVDVLRDLLALLRQTHVGDEGGGQPLKADGGTNVGIGAGDIGPGLDLGFGKALVDLFPDSVLQQTEGELREVAQIGSVSRVRARSSSPSSTNSVSSEEMVSVSRISTWGKRSENWGRIWGKLVFIRRVLAPKRRMPRSCCSMSDRMAFRLASSFNMVLAEESTYSPAGVRDMAGLRYSSGVP